VCDRQSILTSDDRRRLERMARPPLPEGAGRLGRMLRHRLPDPWHGVHPQVLLFSRVTPRAQKKTDMAERPKALNHVGLLFNRPPAKSGLPLI